MSLHGDLLDQADHLAKREPTRPKQASLRRSISAAYYALFHLLVFEASRLFVKDERLANSINRTYGHGDMNEISKAFASGEWPKAFDPVKPIFSVSQELKAVAQAFVDLQQARHDADYNLAKKFTRSETLTRLDQSGKAFEAWDEVRKDDLARIYLACFLLWAQWNKRR